VDDWRLRRETSRLRAALQDVGSNFAGADYALEKTTERLVALEAWARKQLVWCNCCGRVSSLDARGEIEMPEQSGASVMFTCDDCLCGASDYFDDCTNDGLEDHLAQLDELGLGAK
jgi:hypothetical protein